MLRTRRSIRRLALSGPTFSYTYGFGFFLQDYAGYELAMHTGSIDGMCALIGLVPERRLGILRAGECRSRRTAARAGCIRRSISGSARARARLEHGALRPCWRRSTTQARERPELPQTAAVKDTTHPSLPLTQYAGTYRDSAFGDARLISMATGELHAGALSRWRGGATVHEHLRCFSRPRRQAEEPQSHGRHVFPLMAPEGRGGYAAFGITFLRVPTPPKATRCRPLALDAGR